MTDKIRLLRITTTPRSLNVLLKGQLQFMHNNGFEVHAASADGDEIEELVQRENVTHHVIPFTKRFSLVKALWCIWKLIRLMRKLKPDIVHTHSPGAGFTGMMAAKIAGVPQRLHTVAGLPLMTKGGLLKWLLIQIERLTYACANQVYPNSARLRQYIAEHIGKYESKMKVIANGSSNGIDLQFFAPHEEVRNKAEALNKIWRLEQRMVFTFIGRMEREKGIGELIDAFMVVKAQYPAIKLLLIGPQEADLPKVAQSRIEEDPDIIFLGFQKDVRPYLLMTDVFVLPSYREGFPDVLLHAAAMGVPVIASDINGCNEIIRHRINGLLVPSKNTDKLAAAMSALAASKPWRTTYGEKAREQVAKYDQEYVWNEILREYGNREL